MSSGPVRRPLVPKVTLYQNDGVSTYVFDPFASTFDFRLRSLRCTPPFDATGGDFELTMTSSDASNSAMNTILSNIEEGNEVLIAVGKTSATDIFRGVIETITITEPNKNFMDVKLAGPDFGSDILKNRVVQGGQGWIQAKQADGITLDATDPKVLIEQIAQDLLQNEQVYAAPNVSAEDQGIIVNSANFFSTNIRLPQFYAFYEILDDKLSELDAASGCVHYVQPDKNFIMKMPGDNTGAPATFLITDDVNDSVAASWDQTKLGWITPGTSYVKSVETHKRQYFGLGGDHLSLDQKQETASSSDPTFSGGSVQWLACRVGPFPASSNIEKIGLYLSKTGSPTSPLILTLVEDNQGSGTSSKPLGQTIIRVSKEAAGVSSSADWRYFNIVQPIVATQKYWIILEGNGDASNYYNWHKDAGSTGVKSISTDGVSWTTTASTTTYCYRQYYASPLLSIFPGSGVTASDKHLHETVIRRTDITEQGHMFFVINQEASTGLKRKEIFKGKIYSPDNLLVTGQAVRVRKVSSGFAVDGEFIIGRLEYIFDSSDDMSTGTSYFDIEAAMFTDYT